MSVTTPSAGELLREVARIYVRAQRTQAACRDGASTVQCHVMTELLRQERMSQQALCSQLDLDKGWISRAVDALVSDGTICKTPNADDKRSAWLSLSPTGVERARRLNEDLNTHADQVLAKLPAAQHGVIRESLALLLQSLQSSPAEQQPQSRPFDPRKALRLRPARPADQAALTALLAEAGLAPLDLTSGTGLCLLASQGKTLLAAGQLAPCGPVGLLGALVVAPSATGQGVGQRLLEALQVQAENLGLNKLYLLTDRADGYFARHGYTAVPVKAVPAGVRAAAAFHAKGTPAATAMVKALPSR
ncbi:bifunctional helix-turn-helix transcriptional regulator/GNAT family N-acetyltransferase [Chitinimonas sp.]|uniref:bifunctional helix-turn-helix transcriptional regulator/GNAT family N-acetyltransferase n=1 Tax=Chitinimonas sp. TaxID=1934313 RepID=UPI002F940340